MSADRRISAQLGWLRSYFVYRPAEGAGLRFNSECNFLSKPYSSLRIRGRNNQSVQGLLDAESGLRWRFSTPMDYNPANANRTHSLRSDCAKFQT